MNELVKLENGKYGLVKDAVDTITTVENEIKKLKEMQDNYKEQLLKVMEENDILKIEIPELTITRKAPTTRETFLYLSPNFIFKICVILGNISPLNK